MAYIKISKEALFQNVSKIFKNLGVTPSDAEEIATVLIKTEQWGVRSHGILRVNSYVDCLISGGIKAEVPFTVEDQHGAWAKTSANGGLGIPASVKAMKLAMSLAEKYSIGMVNVKESHHNGAVGYYANMCAEQGFIGISMSTGNPIMAVTGSAEKVIGNNPFSYAIPAGKYRTIMLDIAMSAVSDGKIQITKMLNGKLDPGCILDSDGNPSTEPDDYFNGGSLLPFGGHKGYGLSIMVECLAGIMSGAGILNEIDSWNKEKGKIGNTGHLLMAIDIKKMFDYKWFISRVENMVERIKASKKQDGYDNIVLPGELERRSLESSGKNVKLLTSTYELLEAAANKAGSKLEL